MQQEMINDIKSNNGLIYLGSKLKNFYAPTNPTKTKIECWVKLYVYIFNFYNNPKNEGKTFFKSTLNLYKEFNTVYGNSYHYKTIQKGIAKLESLGLATIKRTTMYKIQNGEFDYIKREIILNMEKANQIFGTIYTCDDFLMSLKSKECIKKVIKKRPFVLASALSGLANKVNNTYGTVYSNDNEILAEFVSKISRDYFRVESFFNKFTPSFLTKGNPVDTAINENEKVDLILTIFDVEFLKNKRITAPKLFNRYAKKCIGYKAIDLELQADLYSLGFTLSNELITEFNPDSYQCKNYGKKNNNNIEFNEL